MLSINRRRAGSWVAFCFVACLQGVFTLSGCTSIESDLDGDGLIDVLELLLGTDPGNPDTDDDGVLDGDELSLGTSPLTQDSDGDGLLDGIDPTTDPSTPRGIPPGAGDDVEPNDGFANAVVPVMGNGPRISLTGHMNFAGDVDVYNLGPVDVGDHMVVDFFASDDGLLPSVAVFDHEGALYDTASVSFASEGAILRGLLDFVLRHDARPMYIAVASADDQVDDGTYILEVSIERGGSPDHVNGQVLFIDYRGGTTSDSTGGDRQVQPFDASAIDLIYEGMDRTIKLAIAQTITENFAGWDVQVLSSDRAGGEPFGRHSTIFIGSLDSHALGTSAGVDTYNVDRCDDGIVFSESFTFDLFGQVPTAQSLGEAIGNVVSHEAGHLLGLSHVTEPTALMDAASPGFYLLADQEFKFAPLDTTVFPLGFQDAPRKLTDTVGTVDAPD